MKKWRPIYRKGPEKMLTYHAIMAIVLWNEIRPESCLSRRDSSPISSPYDRMRSLARKEEIGRGLGSSRALGCNPSMEEAREAPYISSSTLSAAYIILIHQQHTHLHLHYCSIHHRRGTSPREEGRAPPLRAPTPSPPR